MNGALLIAGVTAILSINLALPPGTAPPEHSVRPAEPAAGAYAPAAKPPPVPGTAAAGDRAAQPGAAAAVHRFSAQGSQTATSTGAHAYFDVAKPTLATADAHSSAELAVSSADGRQIVQVGWAVNRGVNGDADPHLYVHHWIDGKSTCYNGCGFVVNDATAGAPGSKVAPGAVLRLGIRHFGDAWWITANGINWMGYFPDSRWGGRFTQAGVQQWYGAVTAASMTTCTDMGTGLYGTATSGARIFGIGLFDSAAAPNIAVGSTYPAYYTAFKISPTELRYGGPGAC